MEVIAIIPARGGSKGVPRKNVRLLADKPLIAHSILHCHDAQLISQVYVSTDDDEIAQISQSYGAAVIHRPAALASDEATSESALIHALTEIESIGFSPSLIVFLQCTSPIRSGQDIDGAITKLRQTGADSLLSVSPSHRFLWQRVDGKAIPINYDCQQRQRRQEMNPQYVENGSIYVFKPWVLKERGNRLGGRIELFEMDELSAWEIDSLAEFEVIETLLKRHH
ncbi:acylneuraminate cytidylyltransferase family protein [Sphaerothrix gracilis]|uniref:acylneuraminate cytidylyltransferase family protein n=1 Tax=Sphaerothrix gracilis TaxID=3151835 RepID=UPI0031FBDFB7